VKQRLLASCDWHIGSELAKQVANGCVLNLAKAMATTVDVIELRRRPGQAGKNGQLLVGNIRTTKLGKGDGGELDIRDPRVRRIWFGDGGSTPYILRGRKKEPVQLNDDGSLTLKIRNGECPNSYRSRDAMCQIPLSDIRDIVFASPSAVTDSN
jgi:hypothetical protein